MNPSQYGPFANVVALAGALVAVFSVLLLKMLGGLKRWTWLTSDSPPFLVTGGARILAVALMGAIYVTINRTNYIGFGAAAVLSGLLGFISVIRFDQLRKLHIVSLQQVGTNGEVLADKRGPIYKNVVIGTESELLPDAAESYRAARIAESISLAKFMSGYGSSVNDPEALWSREYLAGIASKLTVSLMYVVLLAVLTVYLSAFVIDVASRSPH